MVRLQYHFTTLLPALLLILLTGCAASGTSGQWARSGEARRTFESGTLLENHTYFYKGSQVQPDAVIAIDNNFTLQTKIWARVDITQKMLDNWMFWFKTDLSWTCPYKGGLIITPDGERAGIWYSKKIYNTVKTPAPGVVEVYSPFSPRGSSCYQQERLDDI